MHFEFNEPTATVLYMAASIIGRRENEEKKILR